LRAAAMCFFPFPDKFHLFLIGDFLGGSVISGSYAAEQSERVKIPVSIIMQS
jgi:hypothetical protein